MAVNGSAKDTLKVAIITGGASGMGLAVAQTLASRGDWEVHIFDLSVQRGEEAASQSSNTTFHKVDVTDYAQLSNAFKTVFTSNPSNPKVDFVFANAGVIESRDFYASFSEEKVPGAEPPPEPNMLSLDVDMKGVVTTSFLALHYFRRSTHKGKGASLILTASCGGFYPSYYSPMYTAAKHGVVGFLRAIAKRLNLEGIRANAICPGIVETNLTGEGGWVGFPQDLFTPVEMVSKTVTHLIDDDSMLKDATGLEIPPAEMYGLTVEINLNNIYVRKMPEYCDDAMQNIMEATDPERQKGGVIKDWS